MHLLVCVACASFFVQQSRDGIYKNELRKSPRDLAEHFGVQLKRGVKRVASRFHMVVER